MDGGHGLIPGVSGNLGDALEDPDGRVENRVELVILERRRLHRDGEGRRARLLSAGGGGETQSQLSEFNVGLHGHIARQ